MMTQDGEKKIGFICYVMAFSLTDDRILMVVVEGLISVYKATTGQLVSSNDNEETNEDNSQETRQAA